MKGEYNGVSAMQQALDQLVEFFETKGVSYSRVDHAVVWPKQGPNDFPIVFVAGAYPGWVCATFAFGYTAEDGPSSVQGLRALRKAAQEKYGGRVEVLCEGRDFTIAGRLRSEPKRLKYEIEDYIRACNDLFTLVCAAVRLGHWKEGWNELALGPTIGNA